MIQSVSEILALPIVCTCDLNKTSSTLSGEHFTFNIQMNPFTKLKYPFFNSTLGVWACLGYYLWQTNLVDHLTLPTVSVLALSIMASLPASLAIDVLRM